MIKISKILVQPVNTDKILVRWEYAPTLENFSEYTFELQRSNSPESGFQTVFKFQDAIQFLDDLNFRRLWKNIYYRVVVTHTQTGKTATSSEYGFDYEPNLEALEIIRRNDILLKNRRHGVGLPVAVFIRKREGVRCECWDSEKKRVRVSNCDDCFQTGYYHGFYDPIIAWGNFTPDSKASLVEQPGEREPNDNKVFFSNYPILLPRDVVIDVTLMRAWMIDGVDTSARRGHLLHQLVTMSLLDRNHVLYKLIERYPDLISKVQEQKNRIKLA